MAMGGFLGFIKLRKTKVWHKLALVVGTLAIPVVVLAYLLLSTNAELSDFARKEKAGVELMQPMRKLYADLIDYRQLVGNQSGKAELQKKQDDIMADIKTVNTAADLHGEMLSSSGATSAFTVKKWEALRGKIVDVATRPSADAYDKCGEVVGDVAGMFADIGESSNLLFDPVLESYYLMDSMYYRIPNENDVLGRMRDTAYAVAKRKTITADEKISLAKMIGERSVLSGTIDGNQKAMVRANKNLGEKLQSSTDLHLKQAGALVDLIDKDLIGAKDDKVKVSPEDVMATGNQAIQSGFKLFEDQEPYLASLLQGRLNDYRRSTTAGLAAIIGGMLIALTVVYVIARGITRQVRSITNMFSAIGIGDFTARAEVSTSDELGEMAASLNTMLDNTLTLIQSQDEKERIQTSINNLLEEMAGIAQGDLTKEAKVTEDITGSIADSVNFMIEHLRKIIGNVQMATTQVSTSANQIQATAEHVSKGSESQAEQILNTSAAIDEMAVSIQQVSENAVLSASVAQQALKNAKTGNQAVQDTVRGMGRIRDQVQETAKRIKRLGESSQEIGQIIQLIDDIADRTSILALNASIQAAMAGDAGRGFAVVAEEVEGLAVRSTDATKKIGTLIKTIQGETNEAVAAMEKGIQEVVEGSKLTNDAGKALVEIESVSNQLAELIQSISLASKQQARGSEALAKSMSEISQITQQTAAGTKQAAVSVNSLATLADDLRESVSTFKLPGHGSHGNGDGASHHNIVVNGNGHGNGNGHSRKGANRLAKKVERT